jgi:glutaminyl-peptide cyclotransferase
MKKIVFLFLTLLACSGTIMVTAVRCKDSGRTDTADIKPVSTAPVINHTVVNRFAHDTSFFTEGLEFYNGQLWESSGGDNEASFFPSAAGILDMKTGKVDIKIQLDKSKYFGEGITFFNDKLYMLTWKSRIGFVYDAKTYKKLQEFPLPSKEGWGLTHDSANIIMSDGSSNLYYLSPDSLKLLKIVGVSDNNGPISNINELEYIDGHIFANQWLNPYVYKINPESGKVVGRIDLTNLAPETKGTNEDPNWNGIAYDSTTKKMYVAGKKWKYLYEIKLQ